MVTAKVWIHGGDYDCSELVRMCYRAVGVLPYGSHMWTGNEIALLTSHGFVERSLSDPQPGDVLWRPGHTEIILTDGCQGGARIDENGTIYGNRQGDQTGREVTKSAYRRQDWSKLLRYVGGGDYEDIPIPIAAALVAESIIENDAHGYSQPNRAGDGTIEEVTLRWDGTDASQSSVTYDTIKASAEVRFVTATNVRAAPSADAELVSTYAENDTCNVCGIVLTGDGGVWGVYVGSKTNKSRYVSLRWAVLA